MKFDLFAKISLIIIVVLLALNIILPMLPSPVPSYAARNIQYKVAISDKTSVQQIESLLNGFSKDGWELVTAYGIFTALGNPTNIFIFKK